MPKDKPAQCKFRADYPALAFLESEPLFTRAAREDFPAHLSNRSLRAQQKQPATTKTNVWYAGLFESAPIGYLALNSKGTVSEINLIGLLHHE